MVSLKVSNLSFRVRAPNPAPKIWAPGLHGVVISLARRKSARFDSEGVHQLNKWKINTQTLKEYIVACTIEFPVAERFLKDTMPDTIRWYPEYAWGLKDSRENWVGFAGLFNFDWFAEFGSLWIHPSYRGQGWARKLTEARVDYILDRESLFKNRIFLSRIELDYSPKVLLDVGFKVANFLDEGGGIIVTARREDLIRTEPPKWKGFSNDFHGKWIDKKL